MTKHVHDSAAGTCVPLLSPFVARQSSSSERSSLLRRLLQSVVPRSVGVRQCCMYSTGSAQPVPFSAGKVHRRGMSNEASRDDCERASLAASPSRVSACDESLRCCERKALDNRVIQV